MAWYSRLTNAVSRGVSRILGRQPVQPEVPPPPQPVVSSTYEQPYEPVQPAAPVGTPEEVMGLPAETPTERLYGEAPVQPAPREAPSFNDWSEYGDEVTIYDPETYDPVEVDRYMTADDWYREALLPADYLRDRYGPNINNIEILQQLDDEGYFVDWDQWRADYEASVSA